MESFSIKSNPISLNKSKVSISLLSANFLNLEKDLDLINKSPIDYIHLDVMDGHFVPNLTFGYEIIQAIRKKTNKVLDTHLMISNPEKYVEKYIESGSDIISIHSEIQYDVIELLKKIKKLKAKPCLVFNPDTSIENIEKYFPYVEQILLMSVHPGFSGQKFIQKTLSRGKEVFEKIKKSNYKIDLQIDGGVSDNNIKEIKEAGFNIFVSGSYLFKENNLARNLAKLLD